jgi:hypothetical protein
VQKKKSRLNTSARPIEGLEALNGAEQAKANGGFFGLVIRHPPIFGVPVRPPHPIYGIIIHRPPVFGIPNPISCNPRPGSTQTSI